MPKGDPAGYLPNVKKARQMAKAKGGSPYTPRAKQAPSSLGKAKFSPGKVNPKVATASRFTPDRGSSRKKGFLDGFTPGFRRVMEGPTRKRSA